MLAGMEEKARMRELPVSLDISYAKIYFSLQMVHSFE